MGGWTSERRGRGLGKEKALSSIGYDTPNVELKGRDGRLDFGEKRERTLEGKALSSIGWGTPNVKLKGRDGRLDFGEKRETTLEGKALSSIGWGTPNVKTQGTGWEAGLWRQEGENL